MTNILNKSGILSWTVENVQAAPSKPGVYVLRSATDIASIIFIGSSENLDQRLKELILSSEISGVSFFDWYETQNVEKAVHIERKWVQKYAQKLNMNNIS